MLNDNIKKKTTLLCFSTWN